MRSETKGADIDGDTVRSFGSYVGHTLTEGNRIVAVVLTRDRRDLLRDCLTALRGQERRADLVIVIDNAGSDGSGTMVREEFPEALLVTLRPNVGAAGGFREGLKRACEHGADWVWLLDDDTIVSPDCLARLLEARAVSGLPLPALLASRVEWTDGRPHPMNRPILRRDDIAHSIACAEYGLAPLRTATWVSLLISRPAIERHGYPIAGYFLWTEDIEYSARILCTEHGYFVPQSVAVHHTRVAHGPAVGAGERFYFHVRNNLFMMRGSSWQASEKPGLAWSLAASILTYLRLDGWRWGSLRVVLRGLRHGLGPVPQA